MLKENFSKKNIFLYIPFIVLFIILFVMNSGWGYVTDDVFYRNLVLMDGWNQILNTVYYRYLSWTSRSLIELGILVLCFFTNDCLESIELFNSNFNCYYYS